MKRSQIHEPAPLTDTDPEWYNDTADDAPTEFLVRSRRRGAYSDALGEDATATQVWDDEVRADGKERPRSQALLQEALESMPQGRPSSHRDLIRWRIPTGLVTALALVLTACALWSFLGSGSSGGQSVVVTEPTSTGSSAQAQQAAARVAEQPTPVPTVSTAIGASQLSTITVHVAGAVASPGVYELPAGSLVNDAVQAAGGALNDADSHALNLAEQVTGGTRIYVPRLGEEAPHIHPVEGSSAGQGSASLPTAAGLVNINTATAAELEELPKVGPVLAQSIITWRQENGGFRSVEELQHVSGIGPATYEVLAPLVTL